MEFEIEPRKEKLLEVAYSLFDERIQSNEKIIFDEKTKELNIYDKGNLVATFNLKSANYYMFNIAFKSFDSKDDRLKSKIIVLKHKNTMWFTIVRISYPEDTISIKIREEDDECRPHAE